MGYFAVDVGGTKVKWAQVAEDLTLGEQGSIDTAFSTADELADAIAALRAEHAPASAAVAISCPGQVPGDEAGTVLGGGALRYLGGYQLGRAVATRCGVPATVENDGKAAALAEYARGALQGCAVGSVIVLGTGEGGGIVVDGRVLRGAHAFAGEYSFVFDDLTPGRGALLHMSGFQCGWPGLRRAVFAEKGLPVDESVDGRELFSWINAGDEAACRGLERYAHDVALLCVNIQALVDPEVIAIGGGISAQPVLVEAIARQAHDFVAGLPFGEFPQPRVVHAQFGNDANLIGATYACLQRAMPRASVTIGTHGCE